jgi:hypothetical protein
LNQQRNSIVVVDDIFPNEIYASKFLVTSNATEKYLFMCIGKRKRERERKESSRF